MHAKKYIFILFLLALAPCFANSAFANEIEIKPVAPGQEYYIMKPGEIKTFEAFGVGWNHETKERIPNAEIKAVRWNFDRRFLEMISTDGKTITLRALKNRTSKLTATGEVGGTTIAKEIFVVIKRDKAGQK